MIPSPSISDSTHGARAVLKGLEMKIAYDKTLEIKDKDGKVVQTLSVLEVVLPVSGETVYIRRGKGRDRINAGNLIKNKENQMEFSYALMAQKLFRANGHLIRFEELVDQWDDEDFDALVDAMDGDKKEGGEETDPTLTPKP